MSLVVVPGDPNADSYATVSEFEAFWASRSGIPAGVGITGGSAGMVLAVTPTAGETVVLDGVTYTYVATLSGATYEVLVGSSKGEARANLVSAVAGDDGAGGVTIGEGTLPHPTVTLSFSAQFGTVTSRAIGSAGDGLAVSDTLTAPNGFGAVTETTGGESTVEVALRAATSWEDNTYKSEWKGVRTYETQRLDHPRENMYFQGHELDPTRIHTSVVEATCILAGKPREDYYADTGAQEQTSGAVKMTRSKLGPLEKQIEYHGSSESLQTYDRGQFPEVEATLEPVLDYASDTAFLRR